MLTARALAFSALASCSPPRLAARAARLPGGGRAAPAGTVAAPVEQRKAASARRDRGRVARRRAQAAERGHDRRQDRSISTARAARSSSRRAGATGRSPSSRSTGDRLSRSGEVCRIEVAGMPLTLTPQERERAAPLPGRFSGLSLHLRRAGRRDPGHERRQGLRVEAGRLPRRSERPVGHGRG